jgi:hypothetical protein
MERDGHAAQAREGRVGIDAEVGVALSGEKVGGVGGLRCHK